MPNNEAGSTLRGEAFVVKANQINGNSTTVEETTEQPTSANGSNSTIQADALVIGAGLSGITAIDRLRKAGLKVKCFESGDDFGGVWFWNKYPGARVDSEAPFYQLNIPEVYREWEFTERFPGHEELRKYMRHIDKTLDLRKDTYFNACVIDARYNEDANQWTIKTQQGHVARAKYLILATGLLHYTYTPDFPGLSEYEGDLYHSGAWNANFCARGKKVGLIGAGSTAVQITQELGKEADELTVLVRRPSYCLPMQQRALTSAEQRQLKNFLPTLFKAGRDSRAGWPVTPIDRSVLDATEAERESTFAWGWLTGGFNFHLTGYNDTVVRPEANQIVYDYWRRQVCTRLTDPAKHAIMAPEEKPYYFGTKRAPLEQDYYEVLNQPNVHIHNLKAAPLQSFTKNGLRMTDGTHYALDAVVLATGFDGFTGSLTKIGLHDKQGVELCARWEAGVSTYLGLTIAGFPNMFMAYTPQAPTALSNGPTIIEAQVETIVDMIKKLEAEGMRSIEATEAAQDEWKASLDAMIQHTLLPFTDSWWNGSNIPGKKAENMTYVAGLNNYEAQCRATMDGWKGFNVVPASIP